MKKRWIAVCVLLVGWVSIISMSSQSALAQGYTVQGYVRSISDRSLLLDNGHETLEFSGSYLTDHAGGIQSGDFVELNYILEIKKILKDPNASREQPGQAAPKSPPTDIIVDDRAFYNA